MNWKWNWNYFQNPGKVHLLQHIEKKVRGFTKVFHRRSQFLQFLRKIQFQPTLNTFI